MGRNYIAPDRQERRFRCFFVHLGWHRTVLELPSHLYTSLVFLLRPEEFGRIGVVPVFRVPTAEIRIPILEFGSGRITFGPYDLRLLPAGPYVSD